MEGYGKIWKEIYYKDIYKEEERTIRKEGFKEGGNAEMKEGRNQGI